MRGFEALLVPLLLGRRGEDGRGERLKSLLGRCTMWQYGAGCQTRW